MALPKTYSLILMKTTTNLARNQTTTFTAQHSRISTNKNMVPSHCSFHHCFPFHSPSAQKLELRDAGVLRSDYEICIPSFQGSYSDLNDLIV